MLVLDFKDAFKQVPVNTMERRFLAGHAAGAWFSYASIMFGVMPGPLLWGRVAALLMRMTQAVATGAGFIHCYVDDPVLIVYGTPAARRRLVLKIVLLWLAVGCRLSWRKGKFGKKVDWIGATFRISSRALAYIEVSDDKRDELVAELRAFKGAVLPRRRVRTLAGRVAWMAGLLPQLRPFSQQPWAALASRQRPGLEWAVHRRQVQVALDWLMAFALGRQFPICRAVAACSGAHITIVTDASPSGGGAVIYILVRHSGYRP